MGKARKAEYLLTRAGVIGREGVGPSDLSGRERGKQGGTADIVYLSLFPVLGSRDFFVFPGGFQNETVYKAMAMAKLNTKTAKHQTKQNIVPPLRGAGSLKYEMR